MEDTQFLPYNSNTNYLGDSKSHTIQRFLNFEKRFNWDPGLKEQIFDHKYREQGYMTEVGQRNSATSIHYNDC